MDDVILLDDLLTYARCPLEWFWEKRAGVEKPNTPEQLVPQAIRQALAFYYAGHAASLTGAVGLVWKDWCDTWGAPGVAADLARYERGRAQILGQFESGKIRRPDGSPYVAPHLTNQYRSLMFNAGLLTVGRLLDEFAAALGLALPEETCGSALGDALADCVSMAGRLSEAAQGKGSGLPAREVVVGWGMPYQVALSDRLRLVGQADLVTRAGPDTRAGEDAVIIEVHDYGSTRATVSGAARHLRVIAASLAEPSPRTATGEAAVSWNAVDHIVYRHMRSGTAFSIRETSPARLLSVVAAAARGMRGQIVVPRLLAGPEDCRACAYRARCFDDGWDALDLLDPTAAARAEQLLAVTQQVRKSVAGDDRAASRVREALGMIEQGLQRDAPDAGAALEVLSETMHALPTEGGGRNPERRRPLPGGANVSDGSPQ